MKNLYGCKQATRYWYKCLNQGILAEGFYQSKIDPCLYLHHDYIIVLYTDNTLIFAKDDHMSQPGLTESKQNLLLRMWVSKITALSNTHP